MRPIRLPATVLLALTLAAGGVSAVEAQDTPVTLRFAISDGESAPTAPLVQQFVDEVANRSGGSVTLAPIWNAGAETEAGFEQGVADLLVEGQADIGMVAGRGWDHAGITSLQALQAPFLITDDALAIAVAESPIADDLLEGMATGGIVGLTLWPEDLRHPFAFEHCIGPLVSPDQFDGLTIRAIPSGVTWDMLGAMGATGLLIDEYDDWVERCDLDGAESGFRQGVSLQADATATGDVVFYPKYQVLAANSVAFDRLGPAQQLAIRDAAVAVQREAIATRPTEADAAAEWCANGGNVVLAGRDGVAAFEAAAQPVFDRLAEDPTTSAAIDAIRELAGTVTPAHGGEACSAAAPSPAPSFTPTPVGSPASPLPEGTWRVILTREEMLAAGALPSDAPAGVHTWTFGDGTAHWEGRYDDGTVQSCDATQEVSGDVVLISYKLGGDCDTEGDTEVDSIRWTLDDEGLHLTLVAIENTYAPEFNHAYLEAKPWQRIE